jgi:basic amino acid/polyamine antiporter, APA family
VREASGDPKNNETPALGLTDAIAIIIGIVIGAGIYETAPLVLANVSSPLLAFGVWALGGVLSLVGAVCYAELASAYPHSGGDYVYLSRAFGRATGFLFGWAQLTVILTGSIGMMAYVFADYARAAWGPSAPSTAVLAISSVVLLTLLNIVSVNSGRRTQNVLTALKVIGISSIVIAGLAVGDGVKLSPPRTGEGSLGLAMIFVLYTFGGWNDAAFVASEVKSPERNLPRALVFGTLLITAIYLIVNAAFIWGLGFDRARASDAIAADLLSEVIGPMGGRVMAVIVMVSALGALSGLIFTGARLFAKVGGDHGALAACGVWHPRLGVPLAALLAQATIAIVLILALGTAAGRALIGAAVGALGLAEPAWAGHGGFDTLLRATAPVFWGFFLMTGLSLFVLRVRDPDTPRPFRVPAYPWVPLLFCATCAYMVQAAVLYAGSLTLVGLAPLALGFIVYAARAPLQLTGERKRA